MGVYPIKSCGPCSELLAAWLQWVFAPGSTVTTNITNTLEFWQCWWNESFMCLTFPHNGMGKLLVANECVCPWQTTSKAAWALKQTSCWDASSCCHSKSRRIQSSSSGVALSMRLPMVWCGGSTASRQVLSISIARIKMKSHYCFSSGSFGDLNGRFEWKLAVPHSG